MASDRTYYRCSSCGFAWRYERPMVDEVSRKCPCGGSGRMIKECTYKRHVRGKHDTRA